MNTKDCYRSNPFFCAQYVNHVRLICNCIIDRLVFVGNFVISKKQTSNAQV